MTAPAAPATPRLGTGAFVVSIDTELAWGEAHRRPGARLTPGAGAAGHDYEREREVIGRILDLFERYRIPATWAVVGHLFLDGCGGGAGPPHPDVVQPDYAWLDGDWLAVDPRSTVADAPHWYGRDIVEAILACPTPQEIGSHSFSHVIVDDPACTPEVFASELAASASAAAGLAVGLRSFVYPRNAIGQVELLAAHGYRAYRGGPPRGPFAGRPAWQRRALAALDKVRPLAGSAVYPVRHDSGVWNVPQTYLFDPAAASPLRPPAIWARRPIARLRQAARARSVFHLWFHPYNVTAAPDRALQALEEICRAADRLREAGDLAVLTMGGLADRLDAA